MELIVPFMVYSFPLAAGPLLLSLHHLSPASDNLSVLIYGLLTVRRMHLDLGQRFHRIPDRNVLPHRIRKVLGVYLLAFLRQYVFDEELRRIRVRRTFHHSDRGERNDG